MRDAKIHRKTQETEITISLEIDGKGKAVLDSSCPFLDHMLELVARHGYFDLDVSCKGDTAVDYHHCVEDTGLVLGKAFRQALGDRAGIKRYGSLLLPMDESLIAAAVDLDGRGALFFDVPFLSQKTGDFDVELCEEFFKAFTREAGATVHLKRLAGGNTHHLIEAVFKSFARALSTACELDPRSDGAIPSSKGTLL